MNSKNNATAGEKPKNMSLKTYAAEKNKNQATKTNNIEFESADDSLSDKNAFKVLCGSRVSSAPKFLSEVKQVSSTSEDDATSSCSEDFSEVEMSPWDSMVFNSTMEYCVQPNHSKRKYSVSFDNGADVSCLFPRTPELFQVFLNILQPSWNLFLGKAKEFSEKKQQDFLPNPL
ncbi:unnamed protein product [Clavelina lepadiformis]|uniref:Uncharacterized protein n=1 Tax=Clavelina lepadiformis TaxID=159417 RepID=A0ABP0G4Z7_CLALP